MRAELTIYSYRTRQETPLAEEARLGGCRTGPGVVVRTTEEGFRLYH